MIRLRSSLFGLGLLVATPLWAAEEGIVEAVGEAQIRDGNEVEAKKAATLDALKKAIEKVVGIYVKSDFSATQQEVVRDNEAEFYSKVRDSVVQKAEGFIDEHQVLDVTVEGDVVKVKVRAHVFESKVKARIKKLTELIAAAGNPKLMVAIQEVYVTTDGTKELAEESVFAAYLEKELIARGFEIRGKQHAQKAVGTTIESYDAWIAGKDEAAAAAREQGADILVAGRVEFHDLGKYTKDEVGGLDALVGQTRIEVKGAVRGINAASGDVFSAKPIQTKEIGTDFARAVHRAFRGRGANLIKQTLDQFLDDAKASFKKTAEQGQSYVVEVRGVKSFRKHGKRFLKLLEAIEGVSSVKQKSFKKGALVVDVLCKCSTSDLQDRIFAAAESQKPFAKIDVEDVSGKRLCFKL